MNSPFSSSPGTCLPGAIVSNFNVQLSGSNFFQQNFQYGFEHYLNEVRQSNSLNGGIPLALSSGLLTQSDWENGYRQIYVNLSRKSSQADDNAIRSVGVTFTNLSPAVGDYYIFAFFQSEITVSTSTGALIN